MSETQILLPHLDFAMRHRIGSLSLDVAFQLTQQWSLLFAPSGAGKTTVLRAVAGLLKPQWARIVLGGGPTLHDGGTLAPDLVMTDTSASIFRPPHLRGIRMVSQHAALFPHLNVLENIRYGALNLTRTPEAGREADDDLEAVLTLCRVRELTVKMPGQLCGGERQRVALARSLASPGCKLLLLDEPFTGLDTSLRDEVIDDLRVWLDRRHIPVLSVTHDIAEAFQLGAEVIKVHEGRVVEQGTAALVLAGERSRLLAQLG